MHPFGQIESPCYYFVYIFQSSSSWPKGSQPNFFLGNRVQLINQEKGNPHFILIIIIGRPPLARLISAYRDRVAGDKLNHEVKVVFVL